jgi:hypothetical protein
LLSDERLFAPQLRPKESNGRSRYDAADDEHRCYPSDAFTNATAPALAAGGFPIGRQRGLRAIRGVALRKLARFFAFELGSDDLWRDDRLYRFRTRVVTGGTQGIAK